MDSQRRLTPFATRALFILLYSCATLQFIRFYVTEIPFYLNLPAYLAGHERLPFQARILPALLMRAFLASRLAQYTIHHQKGAFTPERAPLFLISLVAVVVAAIYAQRLYMRVSSSRSLSFLVYPVLLSTLMWTYSIHLEANFAYPYDLLAVAFFAAGLYYVYCRRFWLLVAVVAIGTLNRETTVLLLPIYLLDAFVKRVPVQGGRKSRLSLGDLRQLPWLRALMLLCLWNAVHLFLFHLFANNDRSEDYVRLKENVRLLTPRLWPALLNICGYTLPIVVVFSRHIQPARFRRYLWVLPVWFAIMFYKAVIVETRVYGEFCPYIAIAAVLIIEDRITRLSSPKNALTPNGQSTSVRV